MKFLLEFVSCCGPVGGRELPPEPVEEPRSGETRALVARRINRVRRKRDRGAGGPESVAEWKPTLCAISEDNTVVLQKVAPEAEEDGRKMVVVKRKASGSRRGAGGHSGSINGGSRNIANLSHGYNDHYRANRLANMMTSLSATPFMI